MDTTADAALERALRERTRFLRLVHVPVATSTQDLAAADGGGEAVYWAEHQTRGRGRQRREWHDEPGLDLSVTFRVRASLPDPVALPAAVPVAALQALEPRLGRELRLKWPNDLLLDGRKVCGVLIDGAGASPPGAAAETWLVGIGINVNRTRFPPDLEATATSLALATGRETDRGALLVDLAVRLDQAVRALAARDHDALEQTFRDRLALLGRRVVVRAGADHEGRLEALDFAQLRLDDGRTFALGAVQSLRSAEA